MSVLKSLKGTFQNVQQDIFDGLRALTSLDPTSRHEKFKQLRADGVSLDCGADLLLRYQKEWSEVQSYTSETAKNAEAVDEHVGDMFTRYCIQWESLCRMEQETATLPTLASSVNNMIQLIGSLQRDFETLEEQLEKLENLCEENTMEREKLSHASQLAAYKKAKETEAFSVKAKLWSHLKDRSKEMETKKSKALKERQEAFLDAFTSDMDYYRKHGHPDTLPSVTEFPKVSSLSEINIEEDKKALDEFLSSGDSEHHAEGAFIEDDYTADYGASEELGDDFPELDNNGPIDFDQTSQNNSEVTPAQTHKSDSVPDSSEMLKAAGNKQTEDSTEACSDKTNSADSNVEVNNEVSGEVNDENSKLSTGS